MSDESTPQPKTLVIAREETIPETQTAVTKGANTPNMTLQAVSPFLAIGIRAFRTYLMSLMGFLTAKATGLDAGMLPGDFLTVMWSSAQLALAPTIFSLLTNSIELLNKLDVKFPLMRG